MFGQARLGSAGGLTGFDFSAVMALMKAFGSSSPEALQLIIAAEPAIIKAFSADEGT